MRLTGPWYTKRGATEPAYRGTLRRADRSPVDLSPEAGVDHVEFVMRRRRTLTPVVEAPADILQEGDYETGTDVGVCEYAWEDGDLDVQPGIYRAEFALYDEMGTLLARVPNDSYQEIVVLGNLSTAGDELEAYPKRVNLGLRAGDDFAFTITVTQEGEPVNVGDEARAQIRARATSEELLAEWQISRTAFNVLLLYLSGEVIATLPRSCVWDCELTPSGPTLVEGRIRVRPQVTRDQPEPVPEPEVSGG